MLTMRIMPKIKRQAPGEQEEQGAVRHTAEGLADPELRSQHAGSRMVARDSSTRMRGTSRTPGARRGLTAPWLRRNITPGGCGRSAPPPQD